MATGLCGGPERGLVHLTPHEQERLLIHVAADCGAARDRDVNAAKNLLAVGPTVSACGAGVRPQRSTPGGQSALKRGPLQREP